MGFGIKVKTYILEDNRTLWRILLFVVVLTCIYCVIYFIITQNSLYAFVKSSFGTAFQTGKIEDGLTINTPTCKITDVDPFDTSIRKFLNKSTDFKCSDKPPLLYMEDQMLRVNEEALSAYQISDITLLKCCYQKIARVQQDPNQYNKDADNQYNIYRTCKEFDREARIEYDFILTVCKFQGRIIYKNVYFFFGGWKPSVQEKLARHFITTNSLESPSKFTNRPLSVLLVGIDSVSRFNMQQFLNKTATFLKKKGAIEFQGFVKVGEENFPNLIAELTGLEESKLVQECWKKRHIKLDNCPFIWKNFSLRDYVTAYSEDAPLTGIFNNQKTGFVAPPVDFYLRPVVQASMKELSKKRLNGEIVCAGDRLSVDIILEHAEQFAKMFSDSPYFGLFWTNSLTHNNVTSATLADGPYLRFFQKLFENPSILNHTLLVFHSDHGVRFGPMRETYMGWLEERMPFFTMWLPDWFHSQYPEAVANLKANSKRLTSPFDVYHTLLSVLDNRFDGESRSSGKGQSLFQVVPLQRTCADAGIDQHWCTCGASKMVVAGNNEMLASVMFTLEHINTNYLSAYNQCESLQLEEMVYAMVLPSDSPQRNYYYHVIAFRTSPGDAMFEATVRYRPENKEFVLMDPVSRISQPGTMNHCVDDYELKKYCFCMKQLGK